MTNEVFVFVFVGQGSESEAVVCSADGSAEAFESARASFTAVVFSCEEYTKDTVLHLYYNLYLLIKSSSAYDVRNVNEIT